MEGCASSYHFEILNYFNPELQFVDTESAIKNKLIDLFSDLQNCGNTSFRVYKTKISSADKTKYDILYSNLKGETIINESHIDDVFASIYTNI